MSDAPTESNSLNEATAQALLCPLTRSKLTQVGDELVAEVGGLRYPIREGIPVLLPDQAALPEGVESLDELKAKFGKDLDSDLDSE